ncbi:MAG: hypothetical protein AMJ54_03550 [Deltaproteobacteria bacterium SG8_13]|nr:MAG: hypothetical protein AMJ54_03550 [Deltaproteobacteria bacterium SG8_13]
MGYRNVYWYRDGLAGWKKAGLPTGRNVQFSHKAPPPMAPQKVWAKIQSGERILLIDIRDDLSRKKFGVIDGPTLHYPLYRLHALHFELPKNRLLVFYDIRGKQAPNACRYLLSYFFDPNNITWLEGGVEAWKNQGLQVKQPDSGPRKPLD